jgi:jumonji domain-containing protein 2
LVNINYYLNKKFWKNVSFHPPLYGADVVGTIMDNNIPWSLNELKTLLKLFYY